MPSDITDINMYGSTLLRSLTFLPVIAASIAIHAGHANAAELDISDTPLFLSSSIPPNIFFEVDDSGSMNWEILTQPHWEYCAYNMDLSEESHNIAPTDDECGSYITDGLWDSYHDDSGLNEREFIFTNSDSGNQDCDNTLESCDADLADNTAYLLDWRIFSADFNALAFNPALNYTPWLGPCNTDGTACGNARFDSARSNPRQGSDGYGQRKNLGGFIFEVWEDDKGFTAPRPLRGTNNNATTTPNNLVDVWDSHTQYIVNADDIKITRITYTPGSATVEDPSGLHPLDTPTETLSGNACFTQLALGSGETCRTIAQIQQQVANWYQYYRRRAHVAKNAIAAVLDENPGYRYGLSVINGHDNLFVQVPSVDNNNYNQHNRTILERLFPLRPSGQTPLRSGLQRVGRYFDNTLGEGFADPIVGSCQKNFAILFTDGYWSGGEPSGIGDEDGDGHTGTLADVAKYYYDLDLSSLANRVPADNFDTKSDQHLVTYTVAYGVKGMLTDTDNPADGWPNDVSGNNLVENSNWGNPTTGGDTPEKIDDLWHAAYNSRGRYITANTATEVVSSLQDALQNIQQRSSSASAVAINAGVLTTSSNIYQARFSSEDWSGDLYALNFDMDTLRPNTTPVWSASHSMPNANQRHILFQQGNDVDDPAAGFRWNNLTGFQQEQLKGRSDRDDSESDTITQNRLNYLRGDTSQELRNGGAFRNRNSGVLGDIINSAPAYVDAPAFNYPDTISDAGDSYRDFHTNHSNRTPMVYVGANDGMLHGFDTTTQGAEAIAYIPRSVFKNLRRLANPDYSHRFYVDGSPIIGDAYIDTSTPNGGNKQWRTVLVGGLNKGGQGIYALDITSPNTFSESNTDILLWDFTDDNDFDADGDGDNDPFIDFDDNDAEESMQFALGNTFAQPEIVRLQNGQWAAIFGNGYNNTQRDDGRDNRSSYNGDAVLYILDLGTGKVIRKISTHTGRDQDPAAYRNNQNEYVNIPRANGLSHTTSVDINSDYTVDYVYAGDVFGNLWKFDLSSNDPANWGVALDDGNGNPAPLFTACAGSCQTGANNNHQPITSKPRVGRVPNSRRLMVFFGTGQFLGQPDILDTSLQSFYGIIDDLNSSVNGRDELLEQTITMEATLAFGAASQTIRVTSDNALITQRGWFLDLDSPAINGLEGERVVQTPVLRGNRIIFVTLTPDTNVCGVGGSSWLMELNAYTGSRLYTTAFDLTGDQRINVSDNAMITQDGQQRSVPPSGVRSDQILSQPTIVSENNSGTELKMSSGSTGNIITIGESAQQVNRLWRQLR